MKTLRRYKAVWINVAMVVLLLVLGVKCAIEGDIKTATIVLTCAGMGVVFARFWWLVADDDGED